ncbi:MAG: SPFH domain-containing protein [Polyangiaceae bacterium]
MGLFEFVKNGVRQMMIARPEDMHHLIVYKHPDRSVPMYTQLTVKSDEWAVFFRDGQLMGAVGAGRHTVDGQNIPFLKNWIDSATGGNVLLAEIFFVRNQPLRNDPVMFGDKVRMTDPVTKMPCTPGFFGKLVIQVVDPVKFIMGLTGQSIQPHDNAAILEYVSERVKSGFSEPIADALKELNTSILEYDSVKSDIEKRAIAHFPNLEEVGLKIAEMVNWQIRLNAKDTERLERIWEKLKVAILEKEAELQMRKMEIEVDVAERKAFVNMANDPAYMRHAQAEAMLGAGEGLAKGGGGSGVAGLGAEMAVGVGMAQMFQQGMVQPQMQHQAVQPAAGAAGVQCTGCGTQSAGGKFCAGCGGPLAPPKPVSSFCSNCGTQVSGKFCAGCGTPAGAAAASPAAAAPPADAAPPASGG